MKRILFPILVFVCCLVATAPALAADTSCGGVSTSIVSCGEGDANSIWAMLEIGLNVLAGLVGIAAIGGLVYGAVLYSSAGDQGGQVTKAKTTIANVVVGLVLFAGMYSFLQFLIPGGVFGRDLSAPVATNTPQDRPSSGSGDGDDGGDGGGTVADPACTDGAAKTGTDVTVSFQNLGRAEPDAKAVFQKLKNSYDSRMYVFHNFAEINEGAEPDERKPLMEVFGSNGWTGANTRVPSLAQIDSKWKRVKSQVIKLHDALELSPKRVMTVAQYARTDSCATKFATINTHFLVNAYNGTKVASRQTIWDSSMKKLKDKVAELQKAGYDIALTADFNNPSVTKGMINSRAKIVVKKIPDYIVAIPAEGRKLTIKNVGTVDTPTGEAMHKNQWARLVFN